MSQSEGYERRCLWCVCVCVWVCVCVCVLGKLFKKVLPEKLTSDLRSQRQQWASHVKILGIENYRSMEIDLQNSQGKSELLYSMNNEKLI